MIRSAGTFAQPALFGDLERAQGVLVARHVWVQTGSVGPRRGGLICVDPADVGGSLDAEGSAV